MARSTYVYVTYIRTTPEKLWTALTDPDFIEQYWFGMRCECEWTPGGQCMRLVGIGENLSFYERAGVGPNVAKVKQALGTMSG